jgi:hypothetical protein
LPAARKSAIRVLGAGARFHLVEGARRCWRLTYYFMVFSESCSFVPICSLARPPAMRRRMSDSRVVRSLIAEPDFAFVAAFEHPAGNARVDVGRFAGAYADKDWKTF